MDLDEQFATLTQGAVAVLPEGALREQLATGRRLRVKAGFDPTAPDLHLGHVVLLEKLRQFQRLGHEICLIVGDFTARIGDPTGRNVTRPPLDEAQILANAASYANQAHKILDAETTRVLFNSHWLGPLTAVDLIGIAARYNVARMLERDDFNRRHKAGQSIALHEFLYPLLQGYDSVVIDADIELGGTDQTFNLLVGRHLQTSYERPAQSILTMPILEGTDGSRKMSKSLDNYIAVTDSPDAMFGKVMSISDPMMWRYYALLGRRTPAEVADLERAAAGSVNPRDLKLQLAEELAARFHGPAAGRAARAAFVRRFTERASPANLPTVDVAAGGPGGVMIGHLVAETGLAASTSEALRLVRQGAVRVDDAVIVDPKHLVPCGGAYLVAVGRRRVARVRVTETGSRGLTGENPLV